MLLVDSYLHTCDTGTCAVSDELMDIVLILHGELLPEHWLSSVLVLMSVSYRLSTDIVLSGPKLTKPDLSSL